jgi:hypothetical protein
MDETHGLRPFDLDAFRANDQRQPLYVIASTVNNGGKGTMETGERFSLYRKMRISNHLC